MDKAKDPSRKSRVSRRQMLKLAGGAAGFTFLQLKSKAAPISSDRFIDAFALEQVADRDPSLRLPILIDMQRMSGGAPVGSPRCPNAAKRF